jgi:hypothetical protein
MLFAFVNKETLEIDHLSRDEQEPFDESVIDKIQVEDDDNPGDIAFYRNDDGVITKRYFHTYGIVRRDTLELVEHMHEDDYKGHDDTIYARVTIPMDDYNRYAASTLVFNPDFTYYSDRDRDKLKEHHGFQHIRRMRNELLKESDWMIAGDAPFSEEKIAAIKQYRQQLRDITNDVYPHEVVFPTKPY